MTSYYLATKLMTMKLDKNEFENIKYDKIKNLQGKDEIFCTFRKILNERFIKDCRLCLKPGVKNIFNNVSDEFNLANGIRNILGIELSKDDGRPQYVCSCCETTIKLAARLKETAETTQWRLQQELDIVADSNNECNEDVWNKPHGGYFNVHGSEIIRDWTCGKCRKVFWNKEEFKEHELLPNCCTTLRSYICETCGSKYKSMSQLKRHRLIHTNELHHACGQCPYRGRTKYSLAVHTRLHSGLRPLRCPECPATFPSASNLASHRKRHLPPAHHCDICQRGFRFKQALLNHIATQHRSAKPFSCNICGQSFATRKMIRRHERKSHNRPKLRPGVTPIYMRQHDTNH